MATTLTEYLTVQNDRLDTIATKAYGNPFNGMMVLRANPSLPIVEEYPPGIRIVIPVQVRGEGRVSDELLPPWKRPIR